MQPFTEQLHDHIKFSYSSFDRVLLRGYLPGLFIEGSVIRLLRNLGFSNHSNGVLRTLTNQFNAHIVKLTSSLDIKIHWWGEPEKQKYHSKINFVEEHYNTLLTGANNKSKVVCIIKAVENVRTFANKEVMTKAGKKFTKMYSCHKFVSQYYVYIKDEELGLCYLKLSSYLPFPCEFYMNGHNYLRQQFDKLGFDYKMKDNSFVEVSDVKLLECLVKDFQPSIALKRIDRWMDLFFRFDKGSKSTRSKLLSHQWYTYQTEVSLNVIFKSVKFLNNYFGRILHKHHTIGLPDRLTEIFGLSKVVKTSKTTQRTYHVQACIKHWLEKNSIKCYNKGGCLLRVETTINNPDLPGLKLKKPACNLQAYYWYGYSCNSRYLNTLSNIDLSSISSEVFDKYQQTFVTEKGLKVPAPDLRKQSQLDLIDILLSSNYHVFGFRNKDIRAKMSDSPKTAKIAYELRKLRVRGAIKKKQNSHYYQLTEEGYKWMYYMIFNYSYFVSPLLSKCCKKSIKQNVENPAKIEEAYMQIDKALSLIKSELKLVA
jgi:DNA-binding PadR family transcriptional regulator